MNPHAPDNPSWISPARELMDRFGGRWEIESHPSGLDVWTAVRKSTDGRHIRVIVARNAAELTGKLETAEIPEPPDVRDLPPHTGGAGGSL
jgi:hypothetical protein